MEIGLNEITYHSRRRDNQNYVSYLPLKIKQGLVSSQQSNRKQGKPMTEYKKNAEQTPGYSPITHLIGSTTQQLHTEPSEFIQGSKQQQTDMLRQKIKTLSLHLRSCLEGNNELQQSLSQCKKKLEEKELTFLNQMARMRAELIILNQELQQAKMKQLQREKQLQSVRQFVDREREERIREIEQRKSLEQQMCESKDRNRQLQRQIQQFERRELSTNSTVKDFQQKITQLTQQLSFKDNQLYTLQTHLNLSTQKQHQNQATISQQQDHILLVQTRLQNLEKSYQQLATQYEHLSSQHQEKQSRIEQLNGNVKELCSNSDHLFEEIKELKTQTLVMNEKLDEKQMQKIELEQQLQKLISDLQSANNSNADINHKYSQLSNKYQQLIEKHALLQQQNLLIEQQKTMLLQQIQALCQEQKQLKLLCINQERKQVQLNDAISRLDQQIRNSKQQSALIKPQRDRERRIKTQIESFSKKQNYDQKYQAQTDHDNYIPVTTNPTNLRFNYLSQKNSQDTNDPYLFKSKNNQLPYQHLLSFQPSQPYKSLDSRVLEEPDYKRRVHTTLEDQQYMQPTTSFLKRKNNSKRLSTDAPLNYSLLDQKRMSSSLYIDDRNRLGIESAYDSELMNTKKNSSSLKNSTQLNSHRFSLDLKSNPQSRLLQQKSTQTTKRSQIPSNIPNNMTSLNSFFSKLDRMKLWTHQSVSIPTTQRQPLQDSTIDPNLNPSNTPYLSLVNHNTDIPIQTIIKQKSSIMQQKSSIIQQRKNLLSYNNVNNQLIQRNILKLKQNEKKPINEVINQNAVSELSPIRINTEQSTNNNKISAQVYRSCKKALYDSAL